ncbi:hypothetical protein BJ508DRAFT_330773 [Ascobolus immersus RN42]|uniref:RING-type domain-containing protein n=1 Tax=Ascobolus immersus RN42 TaxID=1160509 RepID=A0A3N4HY69_ASCIM|nr:hypothetical protein BJ508DRAFT_330773 [Ascobolus immersus RN42]
MPKDTPLAPTHTQCNLCLDKFNRSETFPLHKYHSLTHRYCKSCLRETILAATKSEGRYPPRCVTCLSSATGTHTTLLSKIDTAEALKIGTGILSYPEILAYQAAVVEFETPAKDRVYCHDYRACGSFIPKSSHSREEAKCMNPTCFKKTCTVCYEGIPGTKLGHMLSCRKRPSFGDEEFGKLKESKEWRECGRCGRVVELRDGCHHVK